MLHRCDRCENYSHPHAGSVSDGSDSQTPEISIIALNGVNYRIFIMWETMNAKTRPQQQSLLEFTVGFLC